MNKNKLIAFIGAAALAALSAGCDTAPTNANNSNRANTNANNSNVAIVTNTNTNTAPANTNRDIARADYERERERYDRDWRAEASRLGRTIGQGAEDAWLWSKARTALAAADDLPDTGINVDVDNGVVTLTGNVENNNQRTRAGQAARVEGARDVRNNLTVGAAGGNANANRNGSANR